MSFTHWFVSTPVLLELAASEEDDAAELLAAAVVVELLAVLELAAADVEVGQSHGP